MRIIVLALLSLMIMVGLGVFALTYFSEESEESQVKRQFKEQYPSYSIDHLSKDGNASGAYYNVWYKDPKRNRIELSLCTETGNSGWVCGLTSP